MNRLTVRTNADTSLAVPAESPHSIACACGVSAGDTDHGGCSGSANGDRSGDGEEGVSTAYEQDTPEWASSELVACVKTAVCHLLYHILNCSEYCNGCKNNHPSQDQHECLRVSEDEFYTRNYYTLRKRLVTRSFIPAIKKFLLERAIDATDNKIGIIADTVLCDLRFNPRILEALDHAYRELVGDDDDEKCSQLDKVICVYKKQPLEGT